MTRFDPFACAADPFPAYAAARAAGGALRGEAPFPEAPDTLYLFLHRQCLAALKHPDLLQAPPGSYESVRLSMTAERVLAVLTQSLLLADPPRHGRVRRVMAPPLAPARVAGLRPWLQRQAAALLRDLVPRGGFDATGDLAAPFAIRTLEQVLGLELPPASRLKPLTALVAQAFDFRRAPMTPEVNEACAEIEAAIAESLARGVEPGGMAAALLAEEAAGQLPATEVAANLVLMTLAGQETVVDAFGNALVLLEDRPDQRALLDRRAVDWASAADELLRLGTSVLYAGVRIAGADLEIEGHRVPAGTAVVPAVASASRDTAFAANGDALDLQHPSTGMTYGSGPHVCLGQHLARMEMAVLLEALFTLAPGWRIERARLRPRPLVGFRGFGRLPVLVPGAV